MGRSQHTADLKIRVSADMKARVAAAASALGESESTIVRQALNLYFERRALTYPQHTDSVSAVAEPHARSTHSKSSAA